MFKTRKKLATMAVAAAMGGAVLMAAPAHAVNVSQVNLGEVLFFPYHTVQNSMDTVFTVINTTNRTAVIKVRFREARNSREVRDFNVVLSPYDHWGAAVTKNGNDVVVRTYDQTCTSPILPASATNPGAREINFTDYLYTTASAGRLTSGSIGGYDGGGTDAARLQDGYFEVFLMGLSTTDGSGSSANVVEYNAKHVNGVPRNCAAVDNAFLAIPTNFDSRFVAPAEVLKGHVTYINVAGGQSIDTEPTAIEGWRDGTHAIYAPGDDAPNLSHGTSPVANGLADGVAYSKSFVATNPNATVNATTAVLSADAVINEYASGTNAATSWVVTFPTKHHYTDYVAGSAIGTTVFPPFAQTFVKATTHADYGRSCDTVTPVLFDREERTITPSGTAFSPVQTTAGVRLCYEANVVNYNGAAIFGSGINQIGISTTAVGTSGWVHMTLANTGNVGGNTTVTGLPAIGFSAYMRNAGAGSVNYGSQSAHAFVSGN